MSDKKIRNSIDSLRSDVRELAEAFWAFRDDVSTQQAVTAAEGQNRKSSAGPARTVHTGTLEERMPDTDEPGYISSFGSFRTDGDDPESYRWSLEELPVQELLTMAPDGAVQTLAALGNHQRLSILLMMLACSATANDVVDALSLGTTGAAYHHLNVLQAAGLVEQKRRGLFTIVPGQRPVILTILSAFSGAMATEISGQPDAPDGDMDAGSSTKKNKRKAA